MREDSQRRHPVDVPTDMNLLARIKLGSPSRNVVWNEFHTLYAPMIASFARRLGAPPQEVDDIVQDVLLGFYTKSHEFSYDPSRGKFRGFLKVCTLRALIKRAGKSARFKGVSIDQVNPESLEITQEWDSIWDAELLTRAVNKLREEYAGTKATQRTFEAFERYVLKQQPAETVAAELGITRDSVHQAKHRITEALSREVKALSRYEDG